MMDILPFPKVIGSTPKEQIQELISYLIQFKETLEFALMNISEENLSPDLVKMLNGLGVDIENSRTERESELAQVSSKGSLITVFDVINSDAFNTKLKNEVSNIKFNVNLDTGHLEYAIE